MAKNSGGFPIYRLYIDSAINNIGEFPMTHSAINNGGFPMTHNDINNGEFPMTHNAINNGEIPFCSINVLNIIPVFCKQGILVDYIKHDMRTLLLCIILPIEHV